MNDVLAGVRDRAAAGGGDVQHLSIQIECPGRRATGWSQADEIDVIGTSRKVLVPVVSARMEECHALACDRIEGVRLVGFGAVTSLTGQGEIVFLARTAPAFRDDVLSGMELRRAEFRRDAVLAVALRA